MFAIVVPSDRGKEHFTAIRQLKGGKRLPQRKLGADHLKGWRRGKRGSMGKIPPKNKGVEKNQISVVTYR